MALRTCEADGLSGTTAALCVLADSCTAACGAFFYARRSRPSVLATASGVATGARVFACAADGEGVKLGGAVGGHRASHGAAADGGVLGAGANGGIETEDNAEMPPPHLPSVLLGQDTLAALLRKLCYECPCETACFDRRLSEEFKNVGWGCFTQRGLVEMCLRGLGCSDCEAEGPTPPALASFKELIPNTVAVFWLSCYQESNSETHNICSEHSAAALNDAGRQCTHPLID